MRIIKDGSARTIALENGEVQLSAFEQNPRDIARLKNVRRQINWDMGEGSATEALAPFG